MFDGLVETININYSNVISDSDYTAFVNGHSDQVADEQLYYIRTKVHISYLMYCKSTIASGR